MIKNIEIHVEEHNICRNISCYICTNMQIKISQNYGNSVKFAFNVFLKFLF